MLGESSPTPPGGNLPFLLPVEYITNSNIKAWDLLTTEWNGEMLISAERERGK